MACVSKNTEKPDQTRQWRKYVIDVLGGRTPANPCPDLDEENIDRFLVFLASHGIQVLLLDALEQHDKTRLLPDEVIGKLVVARRVGSMSEIYRLKHLQNILEKFNKYGIQSLVLKGAALAYDLYPQACQRPRVDTDILIRPDDRERVETALFEAGLEKSVSVGGDFISHQSMFSELKNDIRHIYDIHWKISNRNAYVGRFGFEDLYQRCTRLTKIAPFACCLNRVDALLHAVVHYYGHFPADRDRLVWIYDMHLLVSDFGGEEWNALIQRSAILQLDPLCYEALELCKKTFGSPVPEDVVAHFMNSGVQLSPIEQARISGEKWARIDQFKSDWSVLDTRQRYRLVMEYLFPPAEFILKQNHSTNKVLLPWFYTKRIITGGARVIHERYREYFYKN